MASTPDPMLSRRKLSDDELAQLATVTPGDIDAAVASFNQHCPPSARGLLDAKPEDHEKPR